MKSESQFIWDGLIKQTASGGNWFETTRADNIEGLIYTTLGLVSESGELAGEIKKIIRNDNGLVTNERRSRIVSELGDVFWYLYAILNELGLDDSVVYVATKNKLLSRLEADTIKHESNTDKE